MMKEKKGRDRYMKASKILSNNKGLTFVELIIAIVLLVIIIGPIGRSIIAAFEVNKDSRNIMGATEVGRGVMEGFTGNSYIGLLSSYATTDLGNGNRLAQISSDVYNKKENNIRTNGTAFNNLSCTLNTVTTSGGTYSTTAMAKGDKAQINKLLSEFGTYAYTLVGAKDTKLVLHGDNTDAAKPKEAKCLFFCYTNIAWGGYTYDVVGFIVPASDIASPDFYACNIQLGVYLVDGNVHKCTQAGETPMLTLSTGIRNK